MRRLISCLLAAMAALVLLPAAAQARVPATFFGVNWDAEISKDSSDATHDREWRRMRTTGVRTTRVVFEWMKMEPEPGKFDWTSGDRIVRVAAARGIEVLPVVIYAPRWARARPSVDASPPRDPSEYARFLEQLMTRYGRTGTFWAENPDLPRRPVRNWQIWNEPHLLYQWDGGHERDWARDYGKLLRTSFKTIRSRDRRARVVLAGLTNRSYVMLNHLYKRGRIKRYFDVAALHPYTRSTKGVVYLAERFRRVMRNNRDSGPVWITEVGLPASRGRYDSDSELQTNDAGMARFLKNAYNRLASARRKGATKVNRVYWYTWASVYRDSQFRYSGLLQYDGFEGVTAKPAFYAYRSAVRRLR